MYGKHLYEQGDIHNGLDYIYRSAYGFPNQRQHYIPAIQFLILYLKNNRPDLTWNVQGWDQFRSELIRERYSR